MSSTKNFAVAIYMGTRPNLLRDTPDVMGWNQFIQEARYSPDEYAKVKVILLNGRRWIIGDPPRTVLMVLEHSPAAEYLAGAVRASLEFNTGRKPS